jgi:transposase
MQTIVKQVVGIDVAQKELVVCLGRMDSDLSSELYAYHVFGNTAQGMNSLINWVKQRTDANVSLRFVMEATGVYHESLAYFLNEQGYHQTIVLPSKINHYAQTLAVKTVTDKTASQAITRFGLERQLTDWVPPTPAYKKLRQLTRERDQVVQLRTMAKNHIHAEKTEAQPDEQSLRRMKQEIDLFNQQEKEIKAQIKELVKQQEKIKNEIAIITSITGIGELTAVTILGETNGFELVSNKKQLASYAGLDVKEKQSGTSVKGKPRISKKGNRYLRKAMHLPALAAIRSDERFKAIFTRLVAKHGIKMKAAVAVQRKLLELVYTLHKTGSKYNPEYLKKLENSNGAVL